MLIEHFKTNESIDDDRAKKYFSIGRLAARIRDLRKLGYSIRTDALHGTNQFGKRWTAALYVIERAQ